jgi:hypothetical protein
MSKLHTFRIAGLNDSTRWDFERNGFLLENDSFTPLDEEEAADFVTKTGLASYSTMSELFHFVRPELNAHVANITWS